MYFGNPINVIFLQPPHTVKIYIDCLQPCPCRWPQSWAHRFDVSISKKDLGWPEVAAHSPFTGWGLCVCVCLYFLVWKRFRKKGSPQPLPTTSCTHTYWFGCGSGTKEFIYRFTPYNIFWIQYCSVFCYWSHLKYIKHNLYMYIYMYIYICIYIYIHLTCISFE